MLAGAAGIVGFSLLVPGRGPEDRGAVPEVSPGEGREQAAARVSRTRRRRTAGTMPRGAGLRKQTEARPGRGYSGGMSLRSPAGEPPRATLLGWLTASLCLAAIALLLLAASLKKPSPDEASTIPSASVAPVPSAPPVRPPPREPAPVKPLQLLRFSFTSEIKAREPVDRLERAEPGKRVYGHFTFKNTNSEARTIKLVFRVNGERRTMLDLKIEPSLSYRTWGFNTLKDSDKSGELTLEATDDAGLVLTSEKLPIGAKKR